MANTMLAQKSDIISMEQNTSVYGSSALLTASFTVPANTGDIECYPSAACHFNPVGAATTTGSGGIGFMHDVRAGEMFRIKHKDIATAQIIGDDGAITLTVAYKRGAGRADGGGSLSRPY